MGWSRDDNGMIMGWQWSYGSKPWYLGILKQLVAGWLLPLSYGNNRLWAISTSRFPKTWANPKLSKLLYIPFEYWNLWRLGIFKTPLHILWLRVVFSGSVLDTLQKHINILNRLGSYSPNKISHGKSWRRTSNYPSSWLTQVLWVKRKPWAQPSQIPVFDRKIHIDFWIPTPTGKLSILWNFGLIPILVG